MTASTCEAGTRVAPRFGTYDRRPLRVKDDHLGRALAGEDFLLLDGAMGTQLQERGMEAGDIPELLCLPHPAVVTDIHRA